MIDYFELNSQGRTLRGLIHENANNREVPIIIVHGYFSANKIGPHRLYFELAEMLSSIGFSVLRIDLSGMGESDGSIAQIEFWNHVSDVQSSIRALRSRYNGCDKVHLIGHCVGCCNVLKQCLYSADAIDTITLVCPFMPSKNNFVRLLGESSYDNLSHVGYTQRKGLYCRKSFIDAGFTLIDKKALQLAKKHNLFAYIASKDEFSSLDESMMWADNNGIPITVIKNADHNFINVNSRYEFFDKICTRFAELRDP